MRSALLLLASSISASIRLTTASRLSARWIGPIWAAATLITRMIDLRFKLCHCERSEAIQGRARTLDCFASLAMTHVETPSFDDQIVTPAGAAPGAFAR